MHGQAHVKGLAQARELLRGAQTTPIVVVRQHDAHWAAQAHVLSKLFVVRHHHVGGQGHVTLLSNRGHAVQPGRRVFVILQHAAQLLDHLEAGGHGPVGVGVDAQGCPRKSLGQRQQCRHLLLRRQSARFELDALEAIVGDHVPSLGHHLFGAQAFAIGISAVRLVNVFGVFEKQVGAEWHGVSRSAAQQIHDRGASQLALQIEHGHLKSADDLGHVLGHMGAGRQRNLFAQKLRSLLAWRHQRGHSGLHGVEVPGREALQSRCGFGQHIKHGLVTIGLVDAHAPASRFDLDDRAQCPWLVDARRIEQRRITERDGRDANVAYG